MVGILFAATASIAGCASPQGAKTATGAAQRPDVPSFVKDADAIGPNEQSSTERWEAFYSNKDGLRSTAIMARSRDNMIQLACFPGDFFLQIIPRDQLNSPMNARRIAFAFDGGPLMEQTWKAQQLSKRDWDFGADDRDPGFKEVIAGLKSHREVTTVIIESDKEVMRQTYTLEGAAQAIDYVLEACGKKGLL
jgi:hypothetical protein